MKNTNNITLDFLAQLLGEKVWEKNGIRRIYIKRGYSTKKMKTNTYIYETEFGFEVKCFVECWNQPTEWCISQSNRVIESVEEELDVLLNGEGIDIPLVSVVERNGIFNLFNREQNIYFGNNHKTRKAAQLAADKENKRLAEFDKVLQSKDKNPKTEQINGEKLAGMVEYLPELEEVA